jgi:hypothetical protein
MAGNSSGSIPQQTGGGADMKAAYRLFAGDEVTHEAVCAPHFAQTRKAAGQRPLVFLVQDTCVLNFTGHRRTTGLGRTGSDPMMQGLHQQNVLAVDPRPRRPLGLLYQAHHCRTPRPPGSHEDRAGRRAVPLEERESYWWIRAIRTIGAPPEGVRWVHTGDRGEDFFGAYAEARAQHADWLIRCVQNRLIQENEGYQRFFDSLRSQPPQTAHVVHVRRGGSAVEQEVPLRIASCAVTLLPSKQEKEYADQVPVECWGVRIWEPNPPEGEEPLEWLLCTSLPADTPEMLKQIAEGYALRWLIEEFHKCEKTGCKVEDRQLTDTARLEPLLGLLSVLAVWLLQLKYVARDEPDAPASTLFEPLMVDAMARYLRRPAANLTVGAFWRGIGRLGGHPGRKNDGPLGWLRAWRGWQSFQLIVIGAGLYAQPPP